MTSRAFKALVAAFFLRAIPTLAGEFGLSVEAMYASAYIWRGVELDAGRSLQPGVTLSWQASRTLGFDATAWWNLPQEEPLPGHKDELYERDLSVATRYVPAPGWTLSLGWIEYANPRASRPPNGDRPHTQEVFVGARYEGKVASHTAQLDWDFDQYNGVYLDLGSQATLPLGRWLDLESSIHLGFAHGLVPRPSKPAEKYYYQENGLVDGAVGVALATNLSRRLSLRASGTWVIRFDNDKAFGGKDKSSTWSGIALSWRL